VKLTVYSQGLLALCTGAEKPQAGLVELVPKVAVAEGVGAVQTPFEVTWELVIVNAHSNS
jgi:hypothetical protein